jgi:arylsulfatase A-like enzyme
MKTLIIFIALCATAFAADRPNILWITSEDNSPYLGCYGDPLAETPHIDELANEGVRYRNATSNAPVCSTARTTLITGMYPTSIGAENHRSRIRIPENFKLYPELLRAAGYYCTNNAKTDYNLRRPGKIWDESSKQAHYKNRRDDAPFFAVFNLHTTHEGRVAPGEDKTDFRVPPERVSPPPYYPETPGDVIRRDLANYYDLMTAMDKQVGALVDELDKAGLADDTIVFYFGDHGGALPRGKRNIHDSGTRVPLVIRVPDKWSHYSPASAGEWVDSPVGFVDFPATLLNLAEAEIPEYYQGRPFLGKDLPGPREHVFLFRGRMDERYDTVRSVRDRESQYIRNYSPHRPWGQHYSYAFRVLPSMRAWYRAFETGDLVPEQARYWREKPGEEFYRMNGDPFQIQNRIEDSGEMEKIDAMRETLDAEILASRDAGFIPEGMATRLAGDQTMFEYARSHAYPLAKILAVANLASERDSANVPAFTKALADSHPVVRYWGATGCLILKARAREAKPALIAGLEDEMADVRTVCAEALGHLEDHEPPIGDRPLETLAAILDSGNRAEVLAAQNAIDFMAKEGNIPLARAKETLSRKKRTEPLQRIPAYVATLEPETREPKIPESER